MNKYLMLSAAAVLANTAAANAGVHSFTFGTTYGGSYCDGGVIYTGVDGGANSGAVRAWTHTNNNCASGTSEGQGLLGKISGLGKTANMSDTFFQKNYGCNYLQISYTIPKKVATGKNWTLWIGESGFTSFEGNSGVLNNVTAARHVTSHGKTSTLAKVKQLLAK
jgi:hypothetical protein